MRPYFENNNNWNKLLIEFEEWKGTPYRHLTRVKGRGADCTLFIGSMYLGLGILTDINYEYYPRDWHKHTKEEKVLQAILKHYKDHCASGISIERIQGNTIDLVQRGDMLTFNNPTQGITVSHHAGIYKEQDWLINSIENRGVCEMQLGSFWRKRITNIFRIMEK